MRPTNRTFPAVDDLGALQWARYVHVAPSHGYTLASGLRTDGGESEGLVIGRPGSEWRAARLKDVAYLHRRIAALAPTPKSILSFAANHGPLTTELHVLPRATEESSSLATTAPRAVAWRLADAYRNVALTNLLNYLWGLAVTGKHENLRDFEQSAPKRVRTLAAFKFHVYWDDVDRKWRVSAAGPAKPQGVDTHFTFDLFAPRMRSSAHRRRAILAMLATTIEAALKHEIYVGVQLGEHDHIRVGAALGIRSAFGAGLLALLREMAGIDTKGRNCEACGKLFVPARNDARFCSVNCRVASHRTRKSREAKREVPDG